MENELLEYRDARAALAPWIGVPGPAREVTEAEERLADAAMALAHAVDREMP